MNQYISISTKLICTRQNQTCTVRDIKCSILQQFSVKIFTIIIRLELLPIVGHDYFEVEVERYHSGDERYIVQHLRCRHLLHHPLMDILFQAL